MANPQKIKKGDMVYIKSNKGPRRMDWAIGKICTVVTNPESLLHEKYGWLIDVVILDLKHPSPFLKNKEIFATCDELVKINPPDNTNVIEQIEDLELVN